MVLLLNTGLPQAKAEKNSFFYKNFISFFHINFIIKTYLKRHNQTLEIMSSFQYQFYSG